MEFHSASWGKARAALTHIPTLVGADGSPGPVRDGVTIEVELAGEDQRQSDADKSIIETCAELARLTGVANSVSLFSGDAGMLIRAAQREVRAVVMPDEYLRGGARVRARDREDDAARFYLRGMRSRERDERGDLRGVRSRGS